MPYFDQHSLYEDWQHTHQLALDAARAAGNLRGQAVMLRGLGQIRLYRDDYAAATEAFDQALELSRQARDKREEFLATGGLATIDRMLGRYDKSEAHIRQALDIAIATDDPHFEAQFRNALGMVLLAQGLTDQAHVSFDQALELCRNLGDSHREAVVLREASLLYDRIGQTDRALASLRRAQEIFDSIDDERCLAYTQLRTGRVHTAHHNRPQATTEIQHAIAFFARNGNRMEEAECWQLLADLDVHHQDLPTARRRLARALQLWRSIGATQQAAETQERLDRLH